VPVVPCGLPLGWYRDLRRGVDVRAVPVTALLYRSADPDGPEGPEVRAGYSRSLVRADATSRAGRVRTRYARAARESVMAPAGQMPLIAANGNGKASDRHPLVYRGSTVSVSGRYSPA
jgi:hypothetical protein